MRSLSRVWKALTGFGKSHESIAAQGLLSSLPIEEEVEERPDSPALSAPRSTHEHGTVRILSRMSTRPSSADLQRMSQDNASHIIQRAFSKRSLRPDTHITGTEMRRAQRIVLSEGPKRATRERAESTARRLIKTLSVRRRRISSTVTTESERWERGEAERLRTREWVPVEQASSQETRPSLQEQPDIDVAAVRRERLVGSPTSSAFAVLGHAAEQQRRIERKRLPHVPMPPGWQAEHVTPTSWKDEHVRIAKDPFADDQRAQSHWTDQPMPSNEAATTKQSIARYNGIASQRSGKSRRSPPPPPARSRGYSFRRRSQDKGAPLRPGGAEIISRPADAGLNALYF